MLLAEAAAVKRLAGQGGHEEQLETSAVRTSAAVLVGAAAQTSRCQRVKTRSRGSRGPSRATPGWLLTSARPQNTNAPVLKSKMTPIAPPMNVAELGPQADFSNS